LIEERKDTTTDEIEDVEYLPGGGRYGGVARGGRLRQQLVEHAAFNQCGIGRHAANQRNYQ
jgi:hypothetical protein